VTRGILALALAAATSGVAFADGQAVHPRATVEVLDDQAQIDDVISRMQKEQAKLQAETATNGEAALRNDRPPAPNGSSDTHRALAPEPKSQPPGSRRLLRDSHNFERAERPHPKKKP
jgi:hypothetical protein